MSILILLPIVVAFVVIVAGAVAMVLGIRYAGRAQQQRIDAETAVSIASTQPDPAVQQRQAEIEQNLAAADALVAQLEQEPAAPPPSPPTPSTPPAAPPPDPTI